MVKNKHYYKSVRNGYIDHVGYGYGFPEITEEEHKAAREKLLNAPEAEEGYELRLTDKLEWVKIKIESDDISDAMAVTIGG